jgi:hypothetical protein
MCLSCHLPIKDVAANQAASRTAWARSRRGRLLRTRILGLLLYPAAVFWCWLQLPTAMLFVVPGAVAGAWLHVVKGRAWFGLVAFVIVVAVLPMTFWPSMLTGFFSDLTSPE